MNFFKYNEMNKKCAFNKGGTAALYCAKCKKMNL